MTPSISSEPLDQVLNHYDIKVVGIKNESYKDKKGVWWIETPHGFKILKKVSSSEDTLKHLLHAVKHLSSNGVNIPAVNKTKLGSDYVNIEGTCYVLWDAVKGKNPTYDSPQDLAKIVRELAIFHRASKGFSPLPDSKPKYHLGTWVEDYLDQVEDMNRFYKNELAQNTDDPISKLVVKEFPYFYDRAFEAIEGLKGNEYAEWVNKVKKTGGLCHQDFAAGNLFLDPSGKIYIIDTDSLTIDIPARDIRKLLNKIMKKSGKWDLELTKKIAAFYQSENPLSPSEWKVVMYDLMFPHLFIGAMNKYYYKRDKEWSISKYLDRMKEMSAFERTITPILDHFTSLLPK